MAKPEYDQRPDWPELREYIEDETLRIYAKFLPVLSWRGQFATLANLGELARELKRPDIDKLGDHVDAFSKTYSRFVYDYEVLLAAAEKARAQRSGPLQ